MVGILTYLGHYEDIRRKAHVYVIATQHIQKASGSLCLKKRHDEAIPGELKLIFFYGKNTTANPFVEGLSKRATAMFGNVIVIRRYK